MPAATRAGATGRVVVPSGPFTRAGAGPAGAFLAAKARSLGGRARRLRTLTPEMVGIRPQDRPYAPSSAHFAAANQRLQAIDRDVARRMDDLRAHWARSTAAQRLDRMALVEREIDRARRAFGMFFEVLSQRGSHFAPALAAHDAIAADCYAAVRAAAPLVFRGPVLKPLCYMEHGYSPSTSRRGVALGRLLGESNPFPVIRIPWDRDHPWQAVFLHEVAHNLQADLGLWEENAQAVERRVLRMVGDPLVTTIYRRWHKEIFADFAAVLLGGPASAWGMMEFLAHPGARALTYMPGGAHPTGYFRVLLLAELLRRLGFARDAARVERTWRHLYDPSRGHRIPPPLLAASPRTIPEVVDEMVFQTRRNLAQRALVDVMPFTPADERAVRGGAAALARGRLPADLPPRFFVSATHYALRDVPSLDELARRVVHHLAGVASRARPTFTRPATDVVAAAA